MSITATSPRRVFGAGFLADQVGIYEGVSTFDQVMSYAPVRDIKCAKTYFAAVASLDRPIKVDRGFSRPVGAPFELVPVSNPCFGIGPGSTIQVKVLYKGKPMPNVVVSFIPKGVELRGDLDRNHEAVTNANGVASSTLRQAGPLLIATHFSDPTAKGDGYDSIGYSATMWLSVPANCPCCLPSPKPAIKTPRKGAKS